MAYKISQYCLIHSVDSVEEFLKSTFKCSSTKLKKYFSKSFLTRSLKERSVLDLPLNFINEGEIGPMYEGDPLETLYEDEYFFVFEKNPNQFVHPLTYDERDNCLSFLRQSRPELLRVNLKHYDRGLLYRLDYETSGIVVYVKKEALYHELREHFAEAATEKKYLCLVDGNCSLEGKFTHSFTSAFEKGKKVLVNDDLSKGLIGELTVRPLEYNQKDQHTMMEVLLKSGLRHQIRAQMAHLGYPLIGDEFYGGRKASRLYLHALSYALRVSGKEYIFKSKKVKLIS